MKRFVLMFAALLLCLSLCSCESLLNSARELVTGQEASKPPEDYIASFEEEPFSYDLYEEYIVLTKYNGTDEYVTIPSEIDGVPVTHIGELCFNDTEAKVISVSIPDSITTIEEDAFYYADSLTSITIPDSVTSIGIRAFAWCNALESVQFGKGVTEIPDFCFNHCAALKTMVLPDWITVIGARAFSYCENLTEFAVHENVVAVDSMAFLECAALQYVVFESGEPELGSDVFGECPELAVIAAENSSVMGYCRDNGLRWAPSKDVDAVVLEKIEADSSDSSGESENNEQ